MKLLKSFLPIALLLLSMQYGNAQTIVVDQPVYSISSAQLQNSLLDLLRSGTASSIVYIKSFHLNGKNGDGFFVETSEKPDNIIVYKAANGKGWKRINYRNTPQNYGGGDGERYVIYTAQEIAMLYPASVGAVTGDMCDWAAIQTMRIAIATLGKSAEIIRGEFIINKQTDIFKGIVKLTDEDWKGSVIKAVGTLAFDAIATFKCKDATDCGNVNTNFQYSCRGLRFEGNGKGKCFAIYGFQRCDITYNEIRNCDTAIYFGFVMNSTISKNSYFGCEYHEVLENLGLPGCGLSHCQSNNNVLQNNRHVITPGTQVCTTIIDASDISLIQNSYEKNSGGTARIGILFDSKNATVVKQFSIDGDSVADALSIDGMHKEATFTDAFLWAKVSPTTAVTWNNIYDLNPDNLATIDCYQGYAALIMQGGYINPTASTFTNKSAGIKYYFYQVFGPGKGPVFVGTPGTVKVNVANK